VKAVWEETLIQTFSKLIQLLLAHQIELAKD
jgi:hypothetical protein